MSTLACPNCGAPATVHPGQPTAMCTFCSRAFDVSAPQPPAPAASPYGAPPSPYGAPPNPYGPSSPYGAPPPQRPMVFVAPPGEAYNVAAATVSAASWGIFRLLMALIPVFVIALGGGITWFASRSGGASMGSVGGLGGLGGGWTGGAPLVCGGNDSINASDITSTTGITAGGNCHVTCIRCTLVAPVGVTAGGNAQVDLVDSHVTGTSGEGIVASGNASVRLTGSSTLVGKTLNSGNGTITAPSPPQAAVTPLPPRPTSGPSHAAPVPAPSIRH